MDGMLVETEDVLKKNFITFPYNHRPIPAGAKGSIYGMSKSTI
jgi:hypothetical protein